MNEVNTYNIGKYTIGVDTNGEDGIGLTVAIINDDGGIHLLGNCYGDNARCIDLLIKENQQLKEQLEKEKEVKSKVIGHINACGGKLTKDECKYLISILDIDKGE